MGFLETASKITPELAEYVDAIAEMELVFRGDHPIEHSRHNHVHLSSIEWLAVRHPQIDLSIREQAVQFVFERWRARLKSFHPYRQSGYRLYLYEDFAPTISVVADTAHGFPYGKEPAAWSSVDEVFKPFVKITNTKPMQLDCCQESALSGDMILSAVERARGSIRTRAAQSLGLSVAELRKRVEWFYLCDQVNDLRKRFKRRPARFTDQDSRFFEFKIFELRLPANYD